MYEFGVIVFRLANDFVVEEEQQTVNNLPNDHAVGFDGYISAQLVVISLLILTNHVLHPLLLVIVRVKVELNFVLQFIHRLKQPVRKVVTLP